MTHYSNSTTARLEGYARARGLTVGICVTPDNSGGRYHVVNKDGQPLHNWIGLGWTVAEARGILTRWGHDVDRDAEYRDAEYFRSLE